MTTGCESFPTKTSATQISEKIITDEIMNEILDFDPKYLIECKSPEMAKPKAPKEFLKLIAESDMLAKDCLDRHNGLVIQIKERQKIITD